MVRINFRKIECVSKKFLLIKGRDRTPAYIPENLLREYFLPPFETALKAGSPTVMVNSGEVNGLPGHANYHYLTEILKQELKFDGFAGNLSSFLKYFIKICEI
jgi:hypothetical protein